MKLTIREYVTGQAACPFRSWLDGLDTKTPARIQARVLRFETGTFGDHKAVGDGVYEARCQCGHDHHPAAGRRRQSIAAT